MSEIALLEGFDQIAESDWDALAAPEQAQGRPYDPFTTYRFLAALENSGSTGPKTGWLARPLVLREAGKLRAAMPLYVKSHSQGEYIFDHAWAEAYERAGGSYYPKLQAAVPFTPATGRRFLGPERYRKTLWEAAIALTENNGLSSLHTTFCTAEEAEALAGHKGTLLRLTHQYHWENQGYGDFDAFLAQLNSRKRKAIRKERAAAQAHGLRICALTGAEIKAEHWEAFWAFYQDTGSRKWGRPYLTRAAFDAFHRHMRDDILLVLAFEGERAVAGALNFIGRDVLYGRWWGALVDLPFLHFELCYYRAIDWAIANGLKRVEAGAQGEHKFARGYLPRETYSLHWINDPGFRRAVSDYLAQERQHLRAELAEMLAESPFRQSET